MRAPGVMILCLGLLLVPLMASADASTELWNRLLPELEHGLQLEQRQPKLPDSAWFGADKASNRAELDQVLGRMVTLLSGSPGRNYRQRIRALTAAIGRDQTVISQAREARPGAPDRALWRRSKADYDAAIAAAEKRIRQQRAEIGRVKHQFAAALRRDGLDLTSHELDFLLSSVIGDHLIDLGIAFDNVKGVLVKLENLLAASGENLSAARRYYGMYALLLEVLVKMHQQVLATVDHYQQRLTVIGQRSAELTAASRRLLQNDERHRAVLEANIAAQALTRRSARLYADYLRDQAASVKGSQTQLLTDLAVARNTYQTVSLSGELVQLIHAGQQLLAALAGRHMPPLVTFQNLELQREFEKLTRRLRQDELTSS